MKQGNMNNEHVPQEVHYPDPCTVGNNQTINIRVILFPYTRVPFIVNVSFSILGGFVEINKNIYP